MRPSSITHHITSVSTVTVYPKAQVLGGIDAQSVSLLPGAHVNGPVNTTPTLTPIQTTSFSVDFPAGAGAAVLVGPHDASVLIPDRYASIKALPHATITLESGAYYVESLDFHPNSSLRLNQKTGPTRVYVRGSTRLAGTQVFEQTYQGFAVIQVGSGTVNLDSAFRGVVAAPLANVVVKATGNRGVIHAKSVTLHSKATWVHEAPNALVGLMHPPEVDLQACADALQARDDLTGVEQLRAFQSDIARYCSMPATDDCTLTLIGRVNVDYFLAAGKLAGDVWTPAQYLAFVRDRTRKMRAAEDDPSVASALCAGKDADDDWVPDAADACPGTPAFTPTHADGCTDPALPEAPSPHLVRDLLDRSGFLANPNCGQAPMLPKLPAGAFYRPADLAKGTYILSGRIMNQPEGCAVWYLFEVEELNSAHSVIRRYQVAFSESERSTALVGTALTVPESVIQFNPLPGDAGTRGLLGSVNGAAIVRFRVRAMNGAGMRSGWSEWKITTNDDCLLLGFKCGA